MRAGLQTCLLCQRIRLRLDLVLIAFIFKDFIQILYALREKNLYMERGNIIVINTQYQPPKDDKADNKISSLNSFLTLC